MTQPFKFAHAAHADWTQAAQDCMTQLGAIPSAASLGFLYVTDAFADELDAILAFFKSATGVLHWTGSVGVGICATATEYLEQPAMALMLGEFAADDFSMLPPLRVPHDIDAQPADAYFALVHGDPAPSELSKNDSGRLPWAVHAPCRYGLRERVVWQDPRPAVVGADLVIVTQENRLLYNLLAMTLQRPARLAYWGHGRNFQTEHPDGPKERFKSRNAGAVDWWFAYTELSAALLRDAGCGLRDRLKDLNTLYVLGLESGAVLTARQVFDLIYDRIPDIRAICGNPGNRTPEWRECGGCSDGRFQAALALGKFYT